MTKDQQKPIELDGRTGEGGGQLVRIACALAAVVTQPIRITHVRGNREGPRGGGMPLNIPRVDSVHSVTIIVTNQNPRPEISACYCD